MRRWLVLATALGLVLLALVLNRIDLGVVWQRLREIEGWQLATLVGVYLFGRTGGILSWLLTMPSLQATPQWWIRMCRAQAIGDAVERLTPLAGLGGAPVKAVLLKRDYGVRIRDTTTSLVLTRTTDLLAILAFCSIGMALLSTSQQISPEIRNTASVSLAVCVIFTVSFFLAQYSHALSRAAPWLEKHWPSRFHGTRGAALESLVDIENQLTRYYTGQPRRFVGSVLATFAEWVVETSLILLTFGFLEIPISVADAVCIEAFSLLVRSTLFFVPGDIGTQEASLVVMSGALLGSASLGLVLAAVIRLGELAFVAIGLVLGMRSLAELRHAADAADTANAANLADATDIAPD